MQVSQRQDTVNNTRRLRWWCWWVALLSTSHILEAHRFCIQCSRRPTCGVGQGIGTLGVTRLRGSKLRVRDPPTCWFYYRTSGEHGRVSTRLTQNSRAMHFFLSNLSFCNIPIPRSRVQPRVPPGVPSAKSVPVCDRPPFQSPSCGPMSQRNSIEMLILYASGLVLRLLPSLNSLILGFLWR